MKLITTAILLCVAAIAAAAQLYAQPVREVDDFQARNAVEGACSLVWANGAAKGVRSCEAYTVPAGKRLAVRGLNFYCFIPNTANAITWLVMGSTLGNTPAPRYMRLSSSLTAAGTRLALASEQVFTHYEAGTTLRFTAWYAGSDPEGASCHPVLNGFLISMN